MMGSLPESMACLAAGPRLLQCASWAARFQWPWPCRRVFPLPEGGPALADELVGEVFHVVGTAPRIDDLADGGFILQVELGVAGNAGGEVRRQGDRLVQGVGVQGLRMAAGGGQGFNAGAGHVVERVLLREGPAGSLGVRAQGQGLRVLGVELLDELGPQHAARRASWPLP